MTKKNAIFVEKVQYVSRLQRVLKDKDISIESCDIYALRADVEYALQEAGIIFLSVRDLRNQDYQTRMKFSEDLVTEIISSPELDFWQHKGISLGSLNRISAQDYFVQFLYWFDIVRNALEEKSYERVFVFQEPDIDESSKALSNFKKKTLGTVIQLCAVRHSFTTDIIMIEDAMEAKHLTVGFVLKQKLFTLFISILNKFIQVTRKPKKVSLLISDIWRNFQPYLYELPEAEVVLWERSEIFKIGWRNIFKYRMRFMHADVYRTKANIKCSQKLGQSFIENWIETRKKIKSRYVWNTYDLTNHVFDIFEDLIARSENDVLLIEDTFGMLQAIKPDAVLVRASASTQLHFAVLCLVAKQLGIPSIEAQHGLFYLGPASVPKFSSASIMATYGPLASEELRASGYGGICVDIGSPRFDVYTNIKKTEQANLEQRLSLLVVLPDDTTGLWFDTYDVVDLIDMFVSISEENNIVFKARPGAPAACFGIVEVSKKLQNHRNVRLAIHEPLSELFKETGLVVSVYSTIVLEALAAHMPLIYLANTPFHNQVAKLHMSRYSNAVDVVTLSTELRHVIAQYQSNYQRNADTRSVFLQENFCVSTGSTLRFADLIKTSTLKHENTL